MSNKLPKFEGMTEDDQAVLRGAIARVNAFDVERLNEYERRIADLERHNELLRAVAEAADFMAWCYVDQAEESEQMQLRQVLQAAIDGGALEGGE